MSTKEIVQEFRNQVDDEKAYSLKELKDILGDIYKAKKTSTKKAKADNTDKVKKSPSAYNNFIKKRIQELKVERTDVAARDLLTLAAGEWKQLSKMQQEQYKI